MIWFCFISLIPVFQLIFFCDLNFFENFRLTFFSYCESATTRKFCHSKPLFRRSSTNNFLNLANTPQAHDNYNCLGIRYLLWTHNIIYHVTWLRRKPPVTLWKHLNTFEGNVSARNSWNIFSNITNWLIICRRQGVELMVWNVVNMTQNLYKPTALDYSSMFFRMRSWALALSADNTMHTDIDLQVCRILYSSDSVLLVNF